MLTRERKKQLKEFQRILRYRFRNINLLNHALTHKSFAMELNEKRDFYNERLEFLGDAVLGMVITSYIYNKYPLCNEGDLTKIRSQLVNGVMLHRIGSEMSLGKYLLLGKGEKASGGENLPSNIMCALEAVIGAVYLDRGIKHVSKFILNKFKSKIDVVKDGRYNQDYKSLLQTKSLKKFGNIPVYKLISAKGPEHKKIFEIKVYMNGRAYGRGEGSSKKKAEQSAAKNALEKISDIL